MTEKTIDDFEHEDAKLNDADQDFLNMFDDLQGDGDEDVPEADYYYEMEDDYDDED